MMPPGAKAIYIEIEVLESQLVPIPQIVKLIGVSFLEGRTRPQISCIVIEGTRPKQRRILTCSTAQPLDSYLGQYLGTYYLRPGNARHVYLAD